MIDPLHRLADVKRRILAYQRETGQVGAVTYPRADWGHWELPVHWREEVHSPEELWIRYGRAVGLHVRYDILTRALTIRLTRDERDETSITWPGKREGE